MTIHAGINRRAVEAFKRDKRKMNIVSRGGTGALEWANTRARELVSRAAGVDEVSGFDAEMIERNLSPGGCADLLAITYFLHFCCGENK